MKKITLKMTILLMIVIILACGKREDKDAKMENKKQNESAKYC